LSLTLALLLRAIFALPIGGPLRVAECQDADVRLSRPDPVQGSIVLVEIAAGGAVTATWKGRPVALWRAGAKAPFRALIGVDLEQAPVAAPLIVRSGGAECRIDLAVQAGDFPERHLTVARRYVEPSAKDLARAAREAERLEAIFTSTSPDRLWRGSFRLPIDGVEPSSSFGQRRVLNDERRSQHAGVDFGAPAGAPVHATQRGRVALASSLFWSGKTVVVDHGLGLYSFYGHLSAIAVREGQVVVKGTVLGRVGATGRATGPHLHWSARLGSARVNPLDLIALPGA
jgi:murein DD-endopeptidase MepM/ murein hydrolase activator NlpD